MKGNLDTVQDMSVNMGESKNYNLLSVSMNDSPTKVKRSSFARYSMRENLVVSIGVKSKTDNPSIFANSLIPADTEQNHDLIPSPSSKNSDSDSIISACKDGKDFEENRADSANDFSNTPEDNQIMQNQIMKLKSAVFQNPFYEDSNNIESPLRFKMNHLLNIANEIKSLSITQTRTIEEINICNSEEIGTFQARISQKIKTTE